MGCPAGSHKQGLQGGEVVEANIVPVNPCNSISTDFLEMGEYRELEFRGTTYGHVHEVKDDEGTVIGTLVYIDGMSPAEVFEKEEEAE